MFNLLPCPNSIRYSWFWSGPQRQTRGDSSLWPLGTVAKLPSGTSPGPPQNPKIQNPQNPQNPKSPKSQNPKSPKTKIQNPQNPKIQNPQNPNPKSKIPKIKNHQNPKSPKSKIPKIQNPSFFGRILGILDLGFCIIRKQFFTWGPQRPKFWISAEDFGFWGFWILGILDFGDFGFWGFWILGSLDFGFWGRNPKSKIPKIQNPKSKIPKIRPKKLGFWILGIWDFGFWGFWILDFWDFGDFEFWIVGILDFGFWDFGDFGFWGFWGFWILDFGDFGFSGFWGFWILDFGFLEHYVADLYVQSLDFGIWGFWILGILDFGDFGFWGFWILDFGDLGFWILDWGFWMGTLWQNFGCYIRKEDCARRTGSADYISYIHLTEVFNDSRISTVPHLWPKVVEVQILIWFLPPWESYMMQGIDFNRPGGWKFREASHHWWVVYIYIYKYTKKVYILKTCVYIDIFVRCV